MALASHMAALHSHLLTAPLLLPATATEKFTVALDVSISFPKALKVGDVITAEAKEINKTNRTGLYLIEVKNQHDDLVALFKGTCFRTEKDLMPQTSNGA